MLDLTSIKKQSKQFSLPQISLMFISLYDFFGPQGWWPGESTFEVCIGAILAQNTAWKNAERAIKNLKTKELLSAEQLFKMQENKLSEHLRPSGYYKQKAKAVKNFLTFLFSKYEGNVQQMFNQETGILRQQLLDIKGIGPETADSILLYAGNKPIFVVDGYTRRLAIRYNLIEKEASYNDLQELFSKNLPFGVYLFNEYHALIVRLGKTFCLKNQPKCQECPLFKLTIN